MTASRACMVTLGLLVAVLMTAVEQAAAIELGLAEILAPLNAPPKKTIVLDNYKKLPDGSTEPLSHTMLKTQKKNQMWQRIMASNIGLLPLFCAPPPWSVDDLSK